MVVNRPLHDTPGVPIVGVAFPDAQGRRHFHIGLQSEE